MADTLRVGVIGVGGIARTHFPGWQESPHSEVAALADLNPAVLQRVGDRLGVAKRYEDPLALIGDPEIDVIDICTPNMSHAPLAVAALDAGKHVLCEKPLAPTPDDIRRIIAARDRSGRQLMVAQHFRYDGHAQALKAEIGAGTLGTIYHARGWMLRRANCPVTAGFIEKKNSGGGPVIDIGVHILDLTLWMMGGPKAITVSGVTQDRLAHQSGAFSTMGGPIPQTFDVEEFASAFVRLEGGATLNLEVAWLLNHKHEGFEDMQMWLYGDKGGAHWPDNEIVQARNETRQHTTTRLQLAPGGEAHALECMAFAASLAEGAPSPVPAEDALNVISILDGLYRSAALGREVTL